MEQNEDLARLEQFVERLINSHNQLKKENSEVAAQLQTKQQEVAELQEKIKNLQEDRSVMHNQVTGLIGRIDEWEKTFAAEELQKTENPDGAEPQDMSKKASSLFNVTSGQSSESAV